MKKIILGAVLVSLNAANSLAADPPAQKVPAAPAIAAPATVAPPTNWSGFYLGVDAGAVFQNSNGSSNFFQDGLDNIQANTPTPASVVGGVHIGANYQFAPSLVAGIEGDWQASGVRASTCRLTDRPSTNVSCTDALPNDHGIARIHDDTHWIATARGRLGWTNDNLMIYGTGGAAFADIRSSLALSCLTFGCGSAATLFAGEAQSSAMKTGWVAGAGVELLFSKNWTARAEYMHVDVGSLTSTFSPAECSCTLSRTQNFHYEIVRAGFSYKL